MRRQFLRDVEVKEQGKIVRIVKQKIKISLYNFFRETLFPYKMCYWYGINAEITLTFLHFEISITDIMRMR
jgi:hypothetical protein